MTRQKKSPPSGNSTGKAVFKVSSPQKTNSPGSTRTNDPLINSQQAPRGVGALERLAQYQRGRPKAQSPFSDELQLDGESGLRGFAHRENRPWHPLAIDPVTRRVTLDGVTVPDGALLELSSEGGPILARLCLASEGGVWARVDLFALGEHDRIPVALRLYAGAVARFAHAAERGRR